MAKLDNNSRALRDESSLTDRLKSVRYAVYLMALAVLLCPTGASAHGVPANCPSNLATADIIDHDFKVSFCELCDIGTVRLEIENPYSQPDDDLHGITIWDDLNSTGVDRTFLGYNAYWKTSGAPIPHTFSNTGGLLTFDNFPIVPAGEQLISEITVVLEDTPTNTPSTQFVNTAKRDFGTYEIATQ